MSLSTCPACGHDVSQAAKVCPQCGHPLRRRSPLARLVVIVLVVIAISVFAYNKLLSDEAKEAVNVVAVASGVNVTPWGDRAQAILNQGFVSKRQAIARDSLRVTHPTGHFGAATGWKAESQGEEVVLTYSFRWLGGILGTEYTTELAWRAGPRGPLGIEVMEDTASLVITTSSIQALENYFEEHVWPQVMKAGDS